MILVMKRISLILVLIGLMPSAEAQTEKQVDSKISRVTVFLNRAQVTRELKTRVEAGRTNLILSGLTANLDQQSIQVSGKGAITILGINHNQNYLSDHNRPKSLQVLYDSLEFYRKQLLQEQHQNEVLNKEEQLLLSNQKIGGTNQNLSVNELKAMADFYRTRLSEIGNGKIKVDERIKVIHERTTKLKQQIREQNDLYNRNT